MPRLPRVLLSDLQPEMHVSGWVQECDWCGERFLGSKDSAFCQPACRKAAARAVDRDARQPYE